MECRLRVEGMQTKDRRVKTKDRRVKTKDRRVKTKGRRVKTKVQRMKTKGGWWVVGVRLGLGEWQREC